MELYIVRHGPAEPRGEGPDARRALTPKGTERMAEVARGLAVLGRHPSRVLTSPLTRAEQTARILAEALCPDAPFEKCEHLEPGASAQDLLDELKGTPEGYVMIVGHNPDLPALAARLLCGDGEAYLHFKKGAVCCLSFEGAPAFGAGRLEWHLQPAQLCALAAGA